MLHDYDRRAQSILNGYGLEGLTDGSPVRLYHGTTRLFRRFELGKSRDELNDKFYGSGIFFTPKHAVAVEYAEANRNIGFEQSIVTDLKRKNPHAGQFLDMLVKHGEDAWDRFLTDNNILESNGQIDHDRLNRILKGVDPNTINDIAGYIIGSSVKPLGQDDGGASEVFSVLSGGGTGAPYYIYDSLDEIGLNSKVYRPKVYTVTVRGITNPLVTDSQSEARHAKSKGHDATVFHGNDLVRGVPEVVLYDPSKIRINSIEVV